MIMKKIIILLPLLATAASSPPGEQFAAPTPVFAPERFFEGKTEGNGTLKVIMKSAQTVKVRGMGRIEGDTLLLEHVVERTGEPVERKHWRIKKLGMGRYAGTLSDAVGPLSGDASGNRLHFKYRLKKGSVDVEQWIYLRPDGQSAVNYMTLRRLGMQVGTLQETIRRVS